MAVPLRDGARNSNTLAHDAKQKKKRDEGTGGSMAKQEQAAPTNHVEGRRG